MFGVCAGLFCNLATQIKYWISADDALDIFAVHAVGGLTGDLLTGIFAADYIAHLDGTTVIPGGWINGHWKQLGIQLAGGCSGALWSFTITYLVLIAMKAVSKFVPALKLRVDQEDEELGIDDVEIGEYAYDYVELIREVHPPAHEDDLFEEDNLGPGRVTMVYPDKE